MSTRKIADLPKRFHCNDRDHNPPIMRVYSPGVYEHTCPSCGKTITFTIYPHHMVTNKDWCKSRISDIDRAALMVLHGSRRVEPLSKLRNTIPDSSTISDSNLPAFGARYQ
jgi:hypothetical protein